MATYGRKEGIDLNLKMVGYGGASMGKELTKQTQGHECGSPVSKLKARLGDVLLPGAELGRDRQIHYVG